MLITQASSRTKANEVVWEDSFKEGFVKGIHADFCTCTVFQHFHSSLGDCIAVEVRGGPRNVKVTCLQHACSACSRLLYLVKYTDVFAGHF